MPIVVHVILFRAGSPARMLSHAEGGITLEEYDNV
jgi:hypothetical protein